MADDKDIIKLGNDDNKLVFEPSSFLRQRVFGVCVDGSQPSKEALFEALTLLHPKRDKLVLITVHKPKSMLEQKHASSYQAQAAGLVKDWCAPDESIDVVKVQHMSDDARTGILEACKIPKPPVDLLFVGSHGGGGLLRKFAGSIGSVSHFLVNNSPVPVVVVRKPISKEDNELH